jgi:predicted NBD/HSP70 family sugar kinase
VDTRFGELCRLADAGDAGARSVLARAASQLSVMISVLTNMLDVDRVVLGGPFWQRVSAVYLEILPPALERQSATKAVRSLSVAGSVVGAEVGAIGAACVILADVLSPRTSSLLIEAGPTV